jgi:hypothetical protein
MKGSEKQIEWAEKIIAEWILSLNDRLERIMLRPMSEMPPKYFEKAKYFHGKMLEKIYVMDDARHIIEVWQRTGKDRSAVVGYDTALQRWAEKFWETPEFADWKKTLNV